MAKHLDPAAVRHVSMLARLKLSDEQIALYGSQLSRILEYMDQLNELDTTDIPPTAHTLPVHNIFREDRVREGFTVDDALHNAPDCHHDFFQVPKVLDQQES